MPKVRKLLYILCLFFCSFEARAQETTGQFWGSFEADWDFSNFWSLYVNPEYYTLYSGGPRWYSYALTTGVNYYLAPSITLFSGLYNSYTLQTEGEDTFEARPQLGARWNISRPINRIFARVQVKYEWRFFRNINQKMNSRSHRLRVKPELLISLLKKNTLEDRNLNFRFYGEYFRHLDANVEERFWNVFTTTFGFYYRHNPRWRYEARYMIQGSKNTKEQQDPQSVTHIIYLLVTFVIPAKTS